MSVLSDWFKELDRASPFFRMDRGQLEIRAPSVFAADAIRELSDGPLSYARAIPELISAAQDDFQRMRGFDRSSGAVIVSHGAIGGLASVLQTLLKPGDHVLVPVPTWPAIPSLVLAFGGTPILYPFASPRDADNLATYIRARRSERPKVLIINAPSNPAGVNLTASAASEAISVCASDGITVIWDDAYESFTASGPRSRALNAAVPRHEQVILITSMSKRFAAPGLRVGFVRVPNALAAGVWNSCLLQTGGVSRVCQRMAVTLLREGAALQDDIAKTVAERRAAALELFKPEELLFTGQGSGFYLMYKVPAEIGGWNAARAALRHGVGSVPGEIFGLPDSLRLTLNVPSTALADVSERLKSAMATHACMP